jgi:hypothetical protein
MDLAQSNPDTLYIGDNGELLCGAHLGASARMRGRGLSGQPLLEITSEVAALFVEENGALPACEACGKEPGPLFATSSAQ